MSVCPGFPPPVFPDRMKKAKFKFPIDPLEGWSAVAGLIVFIGLGLEIGPEAWGYFVTWYQPPRELFGSALVAIGVFAEVAIGIFIARSSKREQIKSEAAISAANERAAKAEQLAAEANLARVKLEQRMKPRNLYGPGRANLKAVLADKATGAGHLDWRVRPRIGIYRG